MDNQYKTQIIKNIKAKCDLFAKIEVVGDLKVGKTSIVRRLIKNEFLEDYNATVGYEFNPYLIKVNNTIIKFQIWDMCGNDNYRSVLLNLYRNALLGILVGYGLGLISDAIFPIPEKVKNYGEPDDPYKDQHEYFYLGWRLAFSIEGVILAILGVIFFFCPKIFFLLLFI